ncbi:Uncharacterized protein dnl_11500 [Desulfonema limicola]|uniref:Uncharacterized protein n=1 Tax=Desulfonema limicola TaxID=45656 RepID=A0A975B512_9BACT|nr:Uncharacterized protein dnl_11500 [Desulfonema limicola]
MTIPGFKTCFKQSGKTLEPDRDYLKRQFAVKIPAATFIAFILRMKTTFVTAINCYLEY